ncbi:hypothetical protein MKW98_031200, partial [Papaver atlanticum]
MRCSTGFCFQSALSTNLGSACLGSLFVPALVQITAYCKGFVKASQNTWALIERIDNMEQVVDIDITSSICFLTG